MNKKLGKLGRLKQVLNLMLALYSVTFFMVSLISRDVYGMLVAIFMMQIAIYSSRD